MVEVESVSAVMRIGDGDPANPYRDYSAACTLVWERPGVIWIKALAGEVRRSHLREIDAWMRANGVVVLKAMRAPHRALPGFKLVGDHYERRYEQPA